MSYEGRCQSIITLRQSPPVVLEKEGRLASALDGIEWEKVQIVGWPVARSEDDSGRDNFSST